MRGLYDSSRENDMLIRLIEAEGNVSDEEILTALLDGASPTGSPREAARRLLAECSGLWEVCDMPYSKLAPMSGVGEKGARLIKLCGAAVKSINAENSTEGHRRLYTDEEIVDYMRRMFVGLRVERMYMLLLSAQYKILGSVLVAQGDSGGMAVDKKLIIHEIIKYGAANVVLAHNHFAGALPSASDVVTTRALENLLSEMDVSLMDHFVFCENEVKSMRKSGYLKTGEL